MQENETDGSVLPRLQIRFLVFKLNVQYRPIKWHSFICYVLHPHQTPFPLMFCIVCMLAHLLLKYGG